MLKVDVTNSEQLLCKHWCALACWPSPLVIL